jgi:predicted RNase H-like HicB family nuclease
MRYDLSLSDFMDLEFTVRIFKGHGTFVAHVPELDVSSCGDTESEARRNIRDAVSGFLETAKAAGTLNEILEEAGYTLENGRWREPELVGTEQMHLGLD